MVIGSDIEKIWSFDTRFCNLLTELVLLCDEMGEIRFANLAIQRWSTIPLAGQSFFHLLVFDDVHKGEKFLSAVLAASPENPTPPWELLIGTESNYTIATLRGYYEDDQAVIVGQAQPKEVSQLQFEMNDLLSELAESQREIRRQNLALHHALSDQRQLVRTIMHLSAPAVPIWNVSIILSFTGESKSSKVPKIIQEIIQREQSDNLQYIILDMSNVSSEIETVAATLLSMVQVLRTLEIEPVVADADSGIVAALHQQDDENLQGVQMYQDIHQAVRYVGAKLDRTREKG